MGNWLIRYQAGSYYELVGQSADEKPTEGIGIYSLAYELDTAKAFYFDGTEWLEVGGEE